MKSLRALAPSVLALTAAAAASGPAATRAEFANPDGVAVIIGNRDYGGDIPDVDYAHRDAEAFKGYVVDVLGFDPENVIDLRDATQAEMWSTFGSRATADRSELWSYLDSDGRSDVVVYYSGHGAPGLEDKRGYLLPVDADPDTAELNGYPIDVLYENLSSLEEARSVAVYVDACFSGGSGGGGMLIDSASPVYVGADLPAQAGERLTVLTAATGEQLASWDRKSGHGLFTHHLLDALYGKGDADADGQVTAREAKAYLDRHMTRAARRTYKRRQRASFTGSADTVLASAAAGGGGFPERPELALVDAEGSADAWRRGAGRRRGRRRERRASPADRARRGKRAHPRSRAGGPGQGAAEPRAAQLQRRSGGRQVRPADAQRDTRLPGEQRHAGDGFSHPRGDRCAGGGGGVHPAPGGRAPGRGGPARRGGAARARAPRRRGEAAGGGGTPSPQAARGRRSAPRGGAARGRGGVRARGPTQYDRELRAVSAVESSGALPGGRLPARNGASRESGAPRDRGTPGAGAAGRGGEEARGKTPAGGGEARGTLRACPRDARRHHRRVRRLPPVARGCPGRGGDPPASDCGGATCAGADARAEVPGLPRLSGDGGRAGGELPDGLAPHGDRTHRRRGAATSRDHPRARSRSDDSR